MLGESRSMLLESVGHHKAPTLAQTAVTRTITTWLTIGNCYVARIRLIP
jgi:hypothetical protein